VTRAWLGAVVTVVVALTGVPAGAASPPTWASVDATLEAGVDPTSRNPCNRGTVVCVDAVVGEMARRERRLAARCDHNALFADVYRVVTERVRRGWPRDFAAPAWVANLDAVFARFYFDSYDRWKAGDEGVTAAWRIALDAGDDRVVSGMGDIMLGLNAHITRDLPFVLEAVGLQTVEGTSARVDFDGANDLLVATLGATLASVGRQFDPEVAHLDVPGFAADEEAFRALISTWRTEAWTHAQQLVAAPTPEARQVVVNQIEALATSRALALRAATAYVPFVSGTAARDRFCRSRR
jgi:hypothetical protein